jgi:hypothetical protein
MHSHTKLRIEILDAALDRLADALTQDSLDATNEADRLQFLHVANALQYQRVLLKQLTEAIDDMQKARVV